MDPELENLLSDKCLCTNNYESDSGGRRLGRRLLVSFDGTENQFGPQSSHVVEFYSRIVRSCDQLSYYTSGIGTFVKPSSIAKRPRMWLKNKWASMTAHNFQSNLLSGYRFLSDKYETGDQIFLLGFSRGAYQARVLAAMIAKVGLLRTGNKEQIPFAFKMYTDPETSKEIPIDSDHPDGKKTTPAEEFKKAFCYDVSIHFVGVWDTVSSVGAFRNKYYSGAELAENICFFRHALALDERRVKFIPEYIFAKKEFFSVDEFSRPRCKEVWFRGSHSDVGGGNVKNRTSDNGAIPSRWMAYEAMLAGLEMTPFQDGIRVKDLEPKIGKESMTRLYTLLEYVLFIKWEHHSEDRPPLLESLPPLPRRTVENPRAADDFSRAWHLKRPRQIYDHQKLHSSVCLHKKSDDSSKNLSPFARLPKSWTDDLDWTKIIKLLRDRGEDTKVEAVAAFAKSNEIAPVHPLLPNTGPKIERVTRGSAATRQNMSVNTGAVRDIVVHTNLDVDLPEPIASAIELDLLDYDAIPALITGVLRGTNVEEFLERLGVLACTGKGVAKIRDHKQFSSMLRKVYSDKRYTKYAGSATRVAHQVLWHSEVDLYASDEKLWEAILSCVKEWNGSQADSTARSSLLKAGQLLHKTETDEASVKINDAIVDIFFGWQRSFTEHPSPPIQLRSLLTTAVEHDAQDYMLICLAVSSSPHFLDPEFTKALLNFLMDTINTTSREDRTLAMLGFCVLCAIDKEVTLDQALFRPLKWKFIKLGTPMEQMWKLVMPKSSHMLHRFGGKLETMKKLREFLLDPATGFLRGNNRFWVHDALEKVMNGKDAKLHEPPMPALPDQNTGSGYGAILSVGGAPTGGSNVFGGPIVGPLLPSLPLPGGVLPPMSVWAGVEQRPLSTLPLATSITFPSQGPGPTDEELFREMQDFLSTQDLTTVSRRTAYREIASRFPRADISSRMRFLYESFDKIVWPRPLSVAPSPRPIVNPSAPPLAPPSAPPSALPSTLPSAPPSAPPRIVADAAPSAPPHIVADAAAAPRELIDRHNKDNDEGSESGSIASFQSAQETSTPPSSPAPAAMPREDVSYVSTSTASLGAGTSASATGRKSVRILLPPHMAPALDEGEDVASERRGRKWLTRVRTGKQRQ